MSEVEITRIFDDVLGMIYSAKQKAEYNFTVCRHGAQRCVGNCCLVLV